MFAVIVDVKSHEGLDIMILIQSEDTILEAIWKFCSIDKHFTVDDVQKECGRARSTVVHRMLKYQNHKILREEGQTDNKNSAGWNAKPKNLYSVDREQFEQQIGKVVE